jgi:transposase InsO family protein
MAWKVENMKSQKQKFILLYETGKFTKVDLCTHFGISRPTGDAIIKRYEEEGWEALEVRSRRHKGHPNQTPKVIEEAIISERKKHTRWGARKIMILLSRDFGFSKNEIPSETTVNNIMKKHGLTIPRKKNRRRIENQYPIFDPAEPNEIWSIDFKGKFRMGNGVYCHPLTIADSKSRYLFAIKGLERPDTESSKPVFERIFREHGLPLQLHSDNGSPFGCPTSLRRMTTLAVWFMELGITPVYSDPGHPEQNGRHERMHRELKADATRPPGATFRSQQRKFDRFLEEYNNIRPHEALDMRTPAYVHIRSQREYPGIIRDWSYDRNLRTRMVCANGAMRWGQGFVMICSSLLGKYVGLEEIEDGLWRVYYRHVELGIFCERTMRVYDVNDFNL